MGTWAARSAGTPTGSGGELVGTRVVKRHEKPGGGEQTRKRNWGTRTRSWIKEKAKEKGGKPCSDKSTPESAILWEQKFCVLKRSTVRLTKWSAEGKARASEKGTPRSVHGDFAWVAEGAEGDRKWSRVENLRRLLWIELCPPERYGEVLPPSASYLGLIWKEGHCRGD